MSRLAGDKPRTDRHRATLTMLPLLIVTTFQSVAEGQVSQSYVCDVGRGVVGLMVNVNEDGSEWSYTVENLGMSFNFGPVAGLYFFETDALLPMSRTVIECPQHWRSTIDPSSNGTAQFGCGTDDAAYALGVGASATMRLTIPPSGIASYEFDFAYALATPPPIHQADFGSCASVIGPRIMGADLVTSALGEPPSVLTPRRSFQVTDDVENIGGLPTTPTQSRYWLVSSTRADRAGFPLLATTGGQGARPIPSLDPGSRSHAVTTLSVMGTTFDDEYWLLACADDPSVVDETDETNNCRFAAGTVRVVRPDFSLTSLHPVQVVYDADLVVGRSTVFEVEVHVDNCNALPLYDVPIRVGYNGAALPTEMIARSRFNPSIADGTCDVTARLGLESRPDGTYTGFLPLDAQDHIPVTAEVNPVGAPGYIDEANTANNVAETLVNVRSTAPLQVGYVPFAGCDFPFDRSACYPATANVDGTIHQSDKFIRAVYPLSDGGYASAKTEPFYGSFNFPVGVDILNLVQWGKRSHPDVTKFLGIVPDKYWDWHGAPGAAGASYATLGGGVITEGTFTTAAHELGHLHWMNLLFEEYGDTYDGNPAKGFYVAGNMEIGKATQAICFMGAEEKGFDPFFLGSRWVDNEHYQAILSRRLRPDVDPPAIMISGILNTDQSIILWPSFYLPDARLSPTDPAGDYTVRLRDANGAVLSELRASLPFIEILEPGGARPTNQVPFSFTLPYALRAARVEIAHGDQVLVSFSPGLKLLRDAIEAIPDAGFIHPASARRALGNKVAALTNALEARGTTKGVLEALEHDLRNAAEGWLLDDYGVTPVQVSKQEMLNLIDLVASQIAVGGR